MASQQSGAVKDKAAYKLTARTGLPGAATGARATVETTGIDSGITSQAGPQPAPQ
ncbi:hypothetical protein ACNKHL_18235 [Shigella flexneri]